MRRALPLVMIVGLMVHVACGSGTTGPRVDAATDGPGGSSGSGGVGVTGSGGLSASGGSMGAGGAVGSGGAAGSGGTVGSDGGADAAGDAQDAPTAEDARDAGDAADACAPPACGQLDATIDVHDASDTAPQPDAASTLLAFADVVSVLEGASAVTGNVLANDRIPAIPVRVTSVRYGTQTLAIPTSGHVTLTPSSGGTLTVYDTGAFSYLPPYSVNNSYGPVAEVVTYTVTDQNGISSAANLTINIADTAPVAYADFAAVQAGAGVVRGNVITGLLTSVGPNMFYADLLGNDVTGLVRVACGSTDVAVPSWGQVTVMTEHGAYLVIAASGEIVYTPPASVPAQVDDVCTYTLWDSDGSTSSAHLTVTVSP